jgi:acyl carrier protein
MNFYAGFDYVKLSLVTNRILSGVIKNTYHSPTHPFLRFSLPFTCRWLGLTTIFIFINMKVAKARDNDITFIVKDIMKYKLGLEESQLQDSAHLQDDLGIDSLDIVELQMELENKFQIKITDEEAEKMTTVGSIIICVQRKM